MEHFLPQDLRPAFPYPGSFPKEGVRDKLLELLGIEHLPSEARYTVEEQENTEDGLLLTRLSYPNSLGETVEGIMCVPRDAPPRNLAGVVCLPGTHSSAESLTHPRLHQDPPDTGYLFGWGRELARRGFATLSLSLKGSDGREHYFSKGEEEAKKRWREEAKILAPFGRTQMGVMVEETVQAALILAAQPQVDPARLGLVGFSLGGGTTWFAMACSPLFRAAVPICGAVGSTARLILEGDYWRHTAYVYIPHMLRYFDQPQIIAAAICPRYFMVVAPTGNPGMPQQGVDDMVRVVEPAYRAAGHPERFAVHRPTSGSVFTVEIFDWMFPRLHRALYGEG